MALKQKSENLHFDWIIRVMFYVTEECPKFEEKLSLGSKNDIRNLIKMIQTLKKN